MTTGHRNAQGIALDNEGTLWLVENGPVGGDELNHLRGGLDYGWPDTTFGIPYGDSQRLPDGEWLGTRYGSDHRMATLPEWVWTPSVAPTTLLSYSGALFSAWEGDLLVTSLRGESIFRLIRSSLETTDIIGMEPIPIGYRLRDVAELSDGTLLITTDSGELLHLELADPFER